MTVQPWWWKQSHFLEYLYNWKSGCSQATKSPRCWFTLPTPVRPGCEPAFYISHTLQWRHNERNGVLNHQPHDCLINRLFRRRSKKTSKLCVTGLCAGNSPVTGEFPTQMASNAENVSIWWRHYIPLTHVRPGCEPAPSPGISSTYEVSPSWRTRWSSCSPLADRGTRHRCSPGGTLCFLKINSS